MTSLRLTELNATSRSYPGKPTWPTKIRSLEKSPFWATPFLGSMFICRGRSHYMFVPGGLFEARAGTQPAPFPPPRG